MPSPPQKEWEALGAREPQPHEFTGRCRTCFPAARVDQQSLEAGEVSDVGSASSSNSAFGNDELEEALAEPEDQELGGLVEPAASELVV